MSMDDNNQRLVSLANKRFSEIITDGFKLFTHNYGTLIIPLALFQVLLIILNVFLLTDLEWYINSLGISVTEIFNNLLNNIEPTESEMNMLMLFMLANILLYFFQNLIGALVITIAMCSVSSYIFKKQMGIETNFIQSFKSSFNKKMLLVILIIGICLPLSSLLLFFPAVIIFGFFIFLVFTYNMEDTSNPISESRAIAKGSFWRIIGVFIVNFIIIFIIKLFYQSIIDLVLNTTSRNFLNDYNSWIAPETRNYGMLILYQILMSFVDIIFAPLFICLLTVLFSSSKARKILGIQYYGPRYSPWQEYREQGSPISQGISEFPSKISSSEKKIEGKFFCPFCGRLILTPKKFCPNCGEGIEFINE